MKKILLASDNSVFLQVLYRSFSDLGALIDTALTDDELMRKSLGEHYDVIITEFVSPFLNGDDLARALRRRRSKPTVFLASRIGREEMLVSVFESGVDQYLSMPLSASRLKRKVRDELRKTEAVC